MRRGLLLYPEAMTEPAPLPTEPLLTPERLGQWAQETPLADPVLAGLIIDAVSALLRLYGDAYWEAATLPQRASDIGYFVAKNYYLNPRLLRQETTGPLQESIDDRALTGLDFSQEQKDELASLVDGSPNSAGDGLFTMGFIRDDAFTHSGNRHGTVVIYDTNAAWPIEYLDTEDVVVFLPEETP